MRAFVVGSFVVACSVKVARLPRAGESLDAADFVAEPGGKGFNLAVAMLRLGADVDGVFAIGSDPFAGVAEAAFLQAGLERVRLARHEGSTGAGIGFVDDAGENCLAVSLGANRLLSINDVAVSLRPESVDIVAATFESPDAPIREAFARARAVGVINLLNPSPFRPIDPRILEDTTVLVVNRVEAGELGLDRLDDDGLLEWARGLHAAGPRIVVVTLGGDGSVAFERGAGIVRQRAFPVRPIDTIGAGDAFAAGLAAGLMTGLPLAAAQRRAAACGALATQRFGALDAFPQTGALDAFLAEHADLAGTAPRALDRTTGVAALTPGEGAG